MKGLVLVWTLERFHPYLIGRFEQVTDYNPILHIYSKKSKPSTPIYKISM